jgi:hypothetical protein
MGLASARYQRVSQLGSKRPWRRLKEQERGLRILHHRPTGLDCGPGGLSSRCDCAPERCTAGAARPGSDDPVSCDGLGRFVIGLSERVKPAFGGCRSLFTHATERRHRSEVRPTQSLVANLGMARRGSAGMMTERPSACGAGRRLGRNRAYRSPGAGRNRVLLLGSE